MQKPRAGEMVRRFSPEAETSVLGSKRQVKAVISTETLGRDGLIVKTDGIDLSNFRKNPIALFAHDDTIPIAQAIDIRAEGDKLTALVQFPPESASAKSTEIYNLISAGILRGVSIGFDPLEVTDLDPKNPWTGNKRIDACELQEFSFCSVAALPDALVSQVRSRRGGRGKPRGLTAKHQRMADLYKQEIAARKPKPSTKRARPPSRSRLATHRLRALRYQGELRLR